jgi:NAD(P)-dependent dehydrogenase (short-subunit alcohol dehydrogenase family)
MSDLQYVLVTGATGAIGQAIAANIAKLNQHHVVLIARNEKKAIRTTEEIKQKTGNSHVDYAIIDLADHRQIYDFAESWNKPLDVIVNNAAASPRQRTENKYGFEIQFAINVLGYFSMMDAFTPHLAQSSRARIVNVASYWAGGLDFSDPQFKTRNYDNNEAYRQSKQADRMLSKAFAVRLQDYPISVNACHPGDVNSGLSNDLGFGGFETPDQGAKTPVWLATGPAGINNTGKYFEHNKETLCHFSQDQEAVNRIYDLCAEMVS